MSLVQYKNKRNFTRTPEPDEAKKGKANAKQLMFVVQRHQASHLHYDFRLEMEGVLKSWAVPKGPSLNPQDKRLAMHVEDHPYAYRTFEGEIPEGNYGAGVVEIWDEGTYRHIDIEDPKKGEAQLLKDLKNGSLKIVLDGKRLKGEFALVKIKNDKKGNAWLLIKHHDAYSVETPYSSEEHTDPHSAVSEEVERRNADKHAPKGDGTSVHQVLAKLGTEKKYTHFIHPMLAKIAERPFSDDEWVFEVKWDGYRAIAEMEHGKVKLYSRNGLSFEKKYTAVVSTLSELKGAMVLDGEIVVLDEQGNPNFQYLQHYPDVPEGCILMYYVFDLLEWEGKPLDKVPLLERKKMLHEHLSLPPTSIVRYCEHVIGKGLEFFDWAKERNVEGIVAKKRDSLYYRGRRTGEWLKIRNHLLEEAVIVGFTPPQGSRHYFGSLVLGMFEGSKLRYVGHVGTGFDDKSLKELHDRMMALQQEKTPFDKIPADSKSATWVKPVLVCQIKYTEKTKDGQFRHPVFMGLRLDKEAEEVTETPTSAGTGKKKPAHTKMEVSQQNPKDKIVSLDGKEIKLTNQGKLYFPEDRITKGMIVDYYQSMYQYILPYLEDRPESLKRNPNGIHEEGFYHKDAGQEAPDWVKSHAVYSESNHKDIDYILCNDRATLMYLNNLGCIELNPWNSRIGKLDYPDYMVLDIDPSDKNTFDQVVETALAIKEVLDKGGADSYCKTSGATGIHVYVPLGARYTYDQTKDFAHVIAQIVEEQLPFTTLERPLAKRNNRIYIDYLQNRTGQTLSSVYSVRPRKGATVSTPLEWKEVKIGLTPGDFTLFNMLERVQKKGDLFKGVLGKGIDMSECLKKLSQ